MASDVVGTPAAPEAVEAPRRGWLGALDKGLLWSLLELFVLTGFVVAQPLLDVTGKAPDFFIFRRADRLDILLLVGIVTVLPALYLWVFELIMRLAGERARHALHLLIVTSLLAILAMEVGKKLLPLRGKRLGLVAVVVALALGFLYLRQAWLRMWLRYLAPAPLVFALLFATTSPSAKLLLPSASQASLEPAASTVKRPPIVMVFTDEYPDNLFTLFGRSYNLEVKETITQLCPIERCGPSGSPKGGGMKKVLTDTAKLWRQIVAPYDSAVDPASFADTQTAEAATSTATATSNQDDKVTDVKPSFRFKQIGHTDEPGRWTEFLDSIQASDPQPTLYFLHVLMPHVPWRYLPSGSQYPYRNFNGNGMQDNKDWGPGIMDENHERHLLQLAYTDKLIGQLVQRLKEQGMYDKSLLLLTADHGEGFTVGNKTRSLGDRNAHSLMWVPLFIKAPNQTKGRIDDRNWE